MNIIEKINNYLKEEGIVASDIITNTSQGSVDIINKDQCPEGYIWNKKRKICIKNDKIKEK